MHKKLIPLGLFENMFRIIPEELQPRNIYVLRENEKNISLLHKNLFKISSGIITDNPNELQTRNIYLLRENEKTISLFYENIFKIPSRIVTDNPKKLQP